MKILKQIVFAGAVLGGLNASAQSSKHEKKEAIRITYAHKINQAVMDHLDVKEAFQKYLKKEEEASNCEDISPENCVRLGQEAKGLYKEFDKTKTRVKKELEKQEVVEIEYADNVDNTIMDHLDVKQAFQKYLEKEEEASNCEDVSPEDCARLGQEAKELYKKYLKTKAEVEKELEKRS